MKSFGYELNQERLLELQEITIQAKPEELRSLARFLEHVATSMEKHGTSFGHEHYRDWIKSDLAVDLIVARF